MNALDSLSAQLMLGTERRTPQWPALPDPLAALMAQVDVPDATEEARALRLAGALALCADAGFTPPVRAAVIMPCPPETRPVVSAPAWLRMLRGVFDDGPPPLQREALQVLAGRGEVLPAALLPQALDLGRRREALRAVLRPVLGERGRWLASLNADWQVVLADAVAEAADPQLWEEGTLAQRSAQLARLRISDSALARQWLESALASGDARERAALLAVCAEGLSPADEAMLDARLSDRSKEVRQCAAGLLARLPQSTFVARMISRLQALLRQTRKLLRSTWVIDAPEAFGEDWAADGLDKQKPARDSLGERAWWLYQLARHVPLDWWTEHTGMTPEALLKWARGGDWQAALVRAWSDALARAPQVDWARAMLAAPAEGQPSTAELLAHLPLAEREAHWRTLWREVGVAGGRGQLLATIAEDMAARGQWVSEAFADHLLGEIRRAIPTPISHLDYALRQSVPAWLCVIPPASLARAGEGWPTGGPETDYFTDTLARALVVIEHRKTLYAIAE